MPQNNHAVFFLFYFFPFEKESYPLVKQANQILAETSADMNLVLPSPRSLSQLCLEITNLDKLVLLYDDD